jgi:hypothetical protein
MRVYVTSLLGTVAWTSAVFLSCATFAVWLLLGFDRQYAVPKFSLEAPKPSHPTDGLLKTSNGADQQHPAIFVTHQNPLTHQIHQKTP